MGAQGNARTPTIAPAVGPDAGADADVRSVLDSIRRIVHDLRVASRAAEKAVGLTSAQLFVLQKLAEAPAQSLGELAGRTNTDQSSVSVVVRRLTDAQLLRRRRSGADGRRVELSLTAKARALLDKAPAAAQDRLIAALHRTPARRRRQLARLLESLVREVGLDAGAAGMFFEDPATRANQGNHAELERFPLQRNVPDRQPAPAGLPALAGSASRCHQRGRSIASGAALARKPPNG